MELIQTIRAEIERLITHPRLDEEYNPAYQCGLRDLRSFLDTLEESEVKYIRKDALLGWLEPQVYEHNEDRFDDGFNTALGQVIDKLNSL